MNWDDEADLYLKDHYNDTSAKRIAKALGCDPEDVYRRAYKLGLGCRQVWTRREDMAIRLMYFRGARAVHKLLSGRTIGAIWARAWRLGLAKAHEEWVDE
jgi:hypothetical protein